MRLELLGEETATTRAAGAPQPVLAAADHWLGDFRQTELPRAALEVIDVERGLQGGDAAARVHVRTNRTLAFVTLECSTVVGAFSDAGFTMLAGERRTLGFTARAPFGLGAFARGLPARSLRDTYA